MPIRWGLSTIMASPVKFDNPPVAEVVCGVLFDILPNLRAAHFGLFWNQLRADFPRIEEAPPLNPEIEPAIVSTTQQIQFEVLALPPMRRTWLLSSDGSQLIQLQNDRFIFNWKRIGNDAKYPSYLNVIQRFEQRLAEFGSFLKAHNLGELKFRQFELRYVNLIGDRNGAKVLPPSLFLIDHQRYDSKHRFLPEPESFIWNTSYQLPKNAGRLHIAVQPVSLVNTNESVTRIDLTARGMPPQQDERRAWFDLAHEWITFGFADSTSPILQKIWGRTS